MNIGMRSVFALVFSMAASQAAMAATATVTVASGTVSVAPSPLVLAAGDGTAVFQLASKGYTITSASVSGFTCTVASGGQSATCQKTERAAKGELQVNLGVKQTGGQQLPSPDVWIQNE